MSGAQRRRQPAVGVGARRRVRLGPRPSSSSDFAKAGAGDGRRGGACRPLHGQRALGQPAVCRCHLRPRRLTLGLHRLNPAPEAARIWWPRGLCGRGLERPVGRAPLSAGVGAVETPAPRPPPPAPVTAPPLRPRPRTAEPSHAGAGLVGSHVGHVAWSAKPSPRPQLGGRLPRPEAARVGGQSMSPPETTRLLTAIVEDWGLWLPFGASCRVQATHLDKAGTCACSALAPGGPPAAADILLGPGLRQALGLV